MKKSLYTAILTALVSFIYINYKGASITQLTANQLLFDMLLNGLVSWILVNVIYLIFDIDDD